MTNKMDSNSNIMVTVTGGQLSSGQIYMERGGHGDLVPNMN
jgi:hypothetical protein